MRGALRLELCALNRLLPVDIIQALLNVLNKKGLRGEPKYKYREETFGS